MNAIQRHLALIFIPLIICIISSTGECIDLISLEPGMSRGQIRVMLWMESSRNVKFGKDSIIYTKPVVPDIAERQRSLLEFDKKGHLSSVNVQISPQRDSSGPEVLRLYDDVRKWLIGRLGPPSWERRDGSAVPEDILMELSTGRMVRYLQWDNSHAVRFGIPQRANGDVMVEIFIAAKMLPKGSKFWGGRRF